MNMVEGVDFSIGHLLYLFRVGLVFDTPAILYTNALVIVLFLLPFHYKERTGFYVVVKRLFVIINAVCAFINLCDAVYFPFTGKRTTFDVFEEFANEGTGQMLNIFADQAASHWTLFIVFAVVIAILGFGFWHPCKKKSKEGKGGAAAEVSEEGIEGTESTEGAGSKEGWRIRLLSYYLSQVVALVVAIVVSVGMIRGGFSTAVRPITISNANQYVDNPREAAIVLNTVFALIRTYDKPPMTVPEYMTDEEAEAVYSPLHLPCAESKDGTEGISGADAPNTGVCGSEPERRMNVVVFILESFAKRWMAYHNVEHNENGPDGDKQTYTPFFDKLLKEKCYSFRYSFANGRRSIEGMPSVLSSIPNFVTPFFLSPASLNDLSGLARELGENKGYHTAFFHGAENGSMGFEAFARSTGFSKYFGRTEYNEDPNYNGDADFDGTWAIWDEDFLQFYCDRMTEMPQPFLTSVFTASSHSPFELPKRYEGKFREGPDGVEKCISYADVALEKFFKKAETQPWFKNTLFVFTSDHASGSHDAYYTSTLGSFCVPVAFYAPSLPNLRGYDSERVVEQIDIMPTVLGLLGYDKPYVAFGQDIFATPKGEKFAIHCISGMGEYEFVKGDWLMRFDGEKVTAAYRYKTDLLQQHNVLGEVPVGELQKNERLIKSFIQQYMKRMKNNELVVRKVGSINGS
ncbi:MAG: LTA synthase family protein [Bacteroidaceae bacterium]|nr:LTA synthase family protein [Bacteroidaceae bacterium]